ncbi:MAG: phosphoribosylformylglycinamidine synthase, partial [Eggerthellaceae bacterium]|nr:phosphoribosylformylglycinamidine synthase [Eggerthellaceae bacterium]
MVYRIFVEKKEGISFEADALCSDYRQFLGIEGLESIRIFNRYDVEDIDKNLFDYAVTAVFSEPQTDVVYTDFDFTSADAVFAVEPLPGQFDQRADSAAQCIQLLSQGERPLIKTAKVYALYGKLTKEDVDAAKKYVINPVESRESSFALPPTLKEHLETPQSVSIIEGFIDLDKAGLSEIVSSFGLAMDIDDLSFLQKYFKEEEKRDPYITELRVIDTYWSDHCRHTTFLTRIDAIDIADERVDAAYKRYRDARREVYGQDVDSFRSQTLMDIGTIGAKLLNKRGLTPHIDKSEEINACSIHVNAKVDGHDEDWLLMFKNETHNHPTEIEPFGGAATCIGGCIRDPLSGRAYVHQAMRFTGGGDPRASLEETLPGKLPQKKLAQMAAAGYSSYGNQIGLATGHVAEVYHPGYIAKRLECGAVLAAAPSQNVVRLTPSAGDVVILLG